MLFRRFLKSYSKLRFLKVSANVMDKFIVRSSSTKNTLFSEDDSMPKKRLKYEERGASAGRPVVINEVTADLFSCPADNALAHCISADCRMGKGIAAIFKKKYGGVDELKKQNKGIGDVAVLERKPRYVYYLVTKGKFFHKPTYDTLEQSLRAMAEHCERHNVTKVSMPRIGCGLDGLKWPRVADIIREVFQTTNVEVTIYSI